jgi:cold shock CspA family protein
MDNLREGQRVTFEAREDPKNRKSSATNLRSA